MSHSNRQKKRNENYEKYRGELKEKLENLGLNDAATKNLGSGILTKASKDYISIMQTMKATTEFIEKQSLMNITLMTESVIQRFVLMSMISYFPKEVRDTLAISINSLEDEDKFSKEVIKQWTDGLYNIPTDSTEDKTMWN